MQHSGNVWHILAYIVTAFLMAAGVVVFVKVIVRLDKSGKGKQRNAPGVNRAQRRWERRLNRRKR